jgi:3(or 17)beta-hydroxysteroid dehydrogenase
MKRLQDKVALVTGASRGLGAAIAKRFAEEGAVVILTDILIGEGQNLARLLPQAIFSELDVGDEGQWQQVVQETVERFGKIDILVNNAGAATLKTIEETSLAEFQRLERIILEGTFLGCRYALPALKAADHGTIINITALAAERGVGLLPAYAAAKAGVHGLSRSLAVDFKTKNYDIRVNCVAPGPHDTPMTQAAAKERSAVVAGLENSVDPEMGQPIEVANAALFFASDESRHITGQILFVDNGASAGCRNTPFLAASASAGIEHPRPDQASPCLGLDAGATSAEHGRPIAGSTAEFAR